LSFNTHARCDRCERILLVADEDELLEEGWLTVSYGWAEEDRADLCSIDCLVRWAQSDAREKLAEVADRGEEETD